MKATVVMLSALILAGVGLGPGYRAWAAGNRPAVRGGLVFNEFLADPNGEENFDTYGNGIAANADEFVELNNFSDAAINLDGLELWDPGGRRWFTFPPTATVAAGGFVVVVLGVQDGGRLPPVDHGSLAFSAGRSAGSSVVNNAGDNLVLYDPAADDYLQVHFGAAPPVTPTTDIAGFSPTAVRLGAVTEAGDPAAGVSLARRPDGDGAFGLHHDGAAANASPGSGNGAGVTAVRLGRMASRPAVAPARPVAVVALLAQSAGLVWLWHRRRCRLRH